MDEVTQQNAALVEEAAAAAEAMQDQAAQLAEAVSVFRTGEAAASQPARCAQTCARDARRAAGGENAGPPG